MAQRDHSLCALESQYGNFPWLTITRNSATSVQISPSQPSIERLAYLERASDSFILYRANYRIAFLGSDCNATRFVGSIFKYEKMAINFGALAARPHFGKPFGAEKTEKTRKQSE